MKPLISTALKVGLLAAAALAVFPRQGEAAQDEKNDKDAQEETAPSKRAPIGLSGEELENVENDIEYDVDRLIIPPYYKETAGPTTLQFAFPLYFERKRTGKSPRHDLGILPFFWHTWQPTKRADVYFPLYWRFRAQHENAKTDVVLQTYWNRSDRGHNFGFAPLVFLGRDTKEKTEYQVVPPLFWRFASEDQSFLLAGLYYHRAKKEDYDLGLPPLFFAGRDRFETYLVVLPPFYWHFENEITYETTSVVPPAFWGTTEHGWRFGLIPLLYLARDKDRDHTLLGPLYYGTRWPHKDQFGEDVGHGRSHYFPLLLTYFRKAPGLTHHGSSIFYHYYEKEGDYMRMYSPLVWMWGNHRTDDRSWLVPPVAYVRRSPVRDDTMLGLVYWDFHEHHKERTFAIAPLFARNWSLYENRWRMWVAPTFDFGVRPKGYHFRLHPLFYLGKDGANSHLVIPPLFWKFKSEEDNDTVFFPLFWRFEDLKYKDTSTVVFPFWWDFDDPRKQKRSQVAFPFYWDFSRGKTGSRTVVIPPLFWRDKDPDSTMTGVLNVVHHKGREKGNRFWNFKIFPIVEFGHPPVPQGAYWSVLGGLAGWRRQGSAKRLKILWIPFDLSE